MLLSLCLKLSGLFFFKDFVLDDKYDLVEYWTPDQGTIKN